MSLPSLQSLLFQTCIDMHAYTSQNKRITIVATTSVLNFVCFCFQMKRSKELENRAAALKREVEILRASLRQQKDKVQQLHELLASREQVHRYMMTPTAVNDHCLKKQRTRHSTAPQGGPTVFLCHSPSDKISKHLTCLLKR